MTSSHFLGRKFFIIVQQLAYARLIWGNLRGVTWFQSNQSFSDASTCVGH